MAKKPNNEDVSLDMTPMIDVVFQLIIFFVVTLKMSDDKDTTIKLEDGKAGIPLTQEELPPSQLTIDIAKNGRVSLSNITLSDQMLAQKIRERKDALLDEIQKDKDKVSSLWNQTFLKRDEVSKGDYIASLVSNGFMAVDAILLVRKLMKGYSSLFGKDKGKRRRWI